VPVWMDRVRPMLAVRCVSRYVEVFVMIRSAASIEGSSEHHTVRVSLDAEPETTEHWLDSIDKQALFTPDPQALADRLAGASRMRFGFTPYNASPVTADFDVRGFNVPLEAMSRTCRASQKRTKT
jgi:hypothetical protein